MNEQKHYILLEYKKHLVTDSILSYQLYVKTINQIYSPKSHSPSLPKLETKILNYTTKLHPLMFQKTLINYFHIIVFIFSTFISLQKRKIVQKFQGYRSEFYLYI